MNVPEQLRTALADRYLIERELGQGGMATVYLARDLRHERQVALKVLKPELAASLGAERFLREIRIAANLQHPNILAVYDSGDADGFLYYVMPYVEGPSLRDSLTQHGELPVAEAARILRDVADALSHAHAHGVVHRDIKPENIMLSARHALVADFGVAKALSEATGRPQRLTTEGMALGTPQYMAPEQASADPHTDHRADIYAFGVMAYEMLTGQPPFLALSAQAILSAHMTEPPVPVTQRRSAVPPPLAQLVMHCLAKKPADRPQTAEDLLPVLEVLATPTGGITPAGTQAATAVPPAERRRRVTAFAGAAAAVLAIGLLATIALRRRPLAITTSDITAVTTEPGVEFQPAISPDGNEVAFVAGPSPMGPAHLFIRSTVNLAGGAAVRLGETALGSEWLPSWGPDGQSVRYLGCPGASGISSPGCAMRETGKLGGAARTLPVPPGARWAWSPDGQRVAFVRGDTILTASATGADARRAAVHAAETSTLHSLAWSPDGTRIAYVNGNPTWLHSGNMGGSSIWIVDADGGEPRPVTTDEHLNVSPTWLDARHLLFVSNRDGPRGVYLVAVGPGGGRGEPRIVPGVADPHSISFSIGARKLAFARLTLRQNIWSYPLGHLEPTSIRDGRPVTSGNSVIEQHDVSPDGRWLVFDSDRRGNLDLYRVPVGGGEAVPLTALPGDEWGPRWSPDGREIAFYAAAPGAPRSARIMVMPAEGGPPTELTNIPGRNMSPAWSPGGLALAFMSVRPESHRLWILRRDSLGGAWHAAVPFTDFDCYPPAWAPDGSGALCSDGTDMVFIAPQGGVLWRRNLDSTTALTNPVLLGYGGDAGTILVWGAHSGGRQGVWAVPVAGGPPRLVIASDDPALDTPAFFSRGRDRLYLTVAKYESDIWVANLRW